MSSEEAIMKENSSGTRLRYFNLNIKILQKFQNIHLRIIVNAPWHVINDTLRHDLNAPNVRD